MDTKLPSYDYKGSATLADYRQIVEELLSTRLSVFRELNISKPVLERVFVDLGYSSESVLS